MQLWREKRWAIKHLNFAPIVKSGFWQAQTSGYALNAERNELQRAKSDGEKRSKWKVSRMNDLISEEDWLKKCLLCRHYYKDKNDADAIKCRLSVCKFEKYVGRKPNE